MTRPAAVAYLSEVYDRISVPPPLSTGIQSSLSTVKSTVIHRLLLSPATVTRKDVTAYIKRKHLKQSDLEDNIRQQKLRDAMRLKQELEGRLAVVTQSIRKLTPEPVRSSPKPDLRNREARQVFCSEESERCKEASELVQRLRREQLEVLRKKQQREYEDEERKRLESLEEMRRKQQEEQRAKEEKAKHIADIQESIRKRREAMNAKRQLEAAERERLKEQTYANEKLLQDFHKRVLLPIEQERAEVLSRKRLLHQPISPENLEAHSKKHDEQIRLLAAQRQEQYKSPESWAVYTSKFTQSILLQERKEKEDRVAESSEKRKFLEKRKHYGDLVKSFFKPAVDPLKQKELELMKERLKPLPRTARSETKSESPIPYRPRKFKPNPMLPTVKEKRSPSPLDFLMEQRKARENYEVEKLQEDTAKSFTVDWDKELKRGDLSPTEIARHVQTKAQLIEREAQRTALLLSHVNAANPKAIDVCQQLDDAVIDSIKAKLTIFGNLQ